MLSCSKLFVPNLHFYAYPVMDYMCYFLKEAKAMVWAHLPRVMKLIFRYLFFDEFACFFVYTYNIFFGSVWDHKNKHYLSKNAYLKKNIKSCVWKENKNYTKTCRIPKYLPTSKPSLKSYIYYKISPRVKSIRPFFGRTLICCTHTG